MFPCARGGLLITPPGSIQVIGDVTPQMKVVKEEVRIPNPLED